MDPEGEAVSTPRRSGSWRDAFLNRHRKANSDGAEDVGGDLVESRAERQRTRSLSRPRERSQPRSEADSAGGDSFNQQAVLEQDRALIEQLTQRQQRRDRPAVRKPPPPPKVKSHRTSSTASGGSDQRGSETALLSAPQSPSGSAVAELPEPAATPTHAAADTAVAARQNGAAVEDVPPLARQPTPDSLTVSASPEQQASNPPSGTATQLEVTARTAKPEPEAPIAVAPTMAPVVPRTGELFTASDIDNIMSRLGGTSNNEVVEQQGKTVQDTTQCTQNFGDISREFYSEHTIGMPPVKQVKPPEPQKPPPPKAGDDSEFQVPERKALKEQIKAISSWVEDDVAARQQLDVGGDMRLKAGGGLRQPARGGLSSVSATVADPVGALNAALSGALGDDSTEAAIFKKLEEVKRKKGLGGHVSPVFLKDVATQAKPLLPNMSLEKLVRILRLFTSARHEDHDLYLRILGEIPVQVRGMTPEMLTNSVRVLQRLRLHEETYLELFSMEAMNMIRAGRRSAPRAPRRPPAPSQRRVDAAATAAVNNGAAPGPVAPPPSQASPPTVPAPPTEALAPFSATQLIRLGNALSELGAKHNGRFLESFQEQLALAIPRLTTEECELVSPTFATSQLMPDPLRRAFLERCMQVDAGKPLPPENMQAAPPDIAAYQKEVDARRRRVKHFRNIFVLEASVRKETFSFFSSLPAEVRNHLDKVHAGAGALKHEGTSAFSAQIAAVLDQLGVTCDLQRMAGPISLHVVAKATNPQAKSAEVVYECSDASAYFATKQDEKNTEKQFTVVTKMRHRLLQRLGFELVHINIGEWQQMSEAQRVNYMVKLQSFQ